MIRRLVWLLFGVALGVFIMRKLGNSGVEAFSRLMGFLLVCIGVQFVINGFYEVVLEVQALLAT